MVAMLGRDRPRHVAIRNRDRGAGRKITQLSCTGYTTKQALDMGLVNCVAPFDELDVEVEGRQMSGYGLGVVILSKRRCRRQSAALFRG
jgi:hypothetical protein